MTNYGSQFRSVLVPVLVDSHPCSFCVLFVAAFTLQRQSWRLQRLTYTLSDPFQKKIAGPSPAFIPGIVMLATHHPAALGSWGPELKWSSSTLEISMGGWWGSLEDEGMLSPALLIAYDELTVTSSNRVSKVGESRSPVMDLHACGKTYIQYTITQYLLS